MSARQIFEKDARGVDWADVIVANMDGPDPDSGTCWECGYAYQKKPVIVFRTDFRAADEPSKAPLNLMLTESATRFLDLAFRDEERRDFADIDSAALEIIRAIDELAAAASETRASAPAGIGPKSAFE
jgi:nucleoside 2-deoxyribosyltransferase